MPLTLVNVILYISFTTECIRDILGYIDVILGYIFSSFGRK